MKNLHAITFTVFGLLLQIGCAVKPEKKIQTAEAKPTAKQSQISAKNEEVGNATDDYANYYIVIADTSHAYAPLHKKMFILQKRLNIPIDSMGRYFNKNKNLIALPDNDQDEMFAGEYYPRRFPSSNLSLEYLNFYRPIGPRKTIALVTGIYEEEKSADSALTILQQTEKKGFKIKVEIFVGCMN